MTDRTCAPWMLRTQRLQRFLAAWCLVTLVPCWAAPALGVTPDNEHYRNGRFFNPDVSSGGGLLQYWQARFSQENHWAEYQPGSYQVPRATPNLSHQPDQSPQVTWINQATVLVQYRGVSVLTDPVFGRRASPVRFAGPTRISQPGVLLQALPPVDLVILSHDHYDHLEHASIMALRDTALFAAPLGVDRWLIRQGVSPEQVVGLDWWESATRMLRGQPVTFTATPAQHVSGRGLLDRNRRLWASWALTIGDFSLYFGGDTGYNARQFKAIGKALGPFDLALLPIGSYAPRSYLSRVHVDPEHAYKIHDDVKAKRSMAIHWGTFFLTAEHPSEPPALLADLAAQRPEARDTFATFALGETRRVPLTTAPRDCHRSSAAWCYEFESIDARASN